MMLPSSRLLLPVLVTILLLLSGASCTATKYQQQKQQQQQQQHVTINAAAYKHVYDGHGALSAGASSRLLWDYEEPHRSNILDFLFLPNFGASLHLLKVEIGGDTQSTDGTEPSHMHTRHDLSCTRGYEFWLLKQAKLRNPAIVTYALSWGTPAWVGNETYFSQDNLGYQLAFLECVRSTLNFTVDYIGIWNERSWGSTQYVTALRQALDSNGFTDTKIVIPDGWLHQPLLDALATDAEFNASIDAVGLHYPCKGQNSEAVGQLGKAFWASEDYSTVAGWEGAGCWGRLLNDNFVRMNMTSTIAWSLIWSVYPNFIYYGNGLMYAMEPWSGHYVVSAPVWTSAHWTQFTRVGWSLLTPFQSAAPHMPYGSGTLQGGGTFVTAVSPDGADASIILETLEGNCLRCAGRIASPTNLTIELVGFEGGRGGKGGGAGSLPATMTLWSTNESHPFVFVGNVEVDAGTGSLSLQVQPDTMYTLSTLTTARHGRHAAPPAAAPFPASYATDFDSLHNDSMAPYLAAQGGSFAARPFAGASSIGRDEGVAAPSGMVLQQVVALPPGLNSWTPNPNPITLLGDAEAWHSYSVSVDALLVRGAIGGHLAGSGEAPLGSLWMAPCDAAIAGQAWLLDEPAPQFVQNARTHTCLNVDACGRDVIAYHCVTSGVTCCGIGCYHNEQWSLRALPQGSPQGSGPAQQLVSALNGQCVASNTSGLMHLEPCNASDTSQHWLHNGTTGQLMAAATRRCATTQLQATQVYTRFCGHIGNFTGVNAAEANLAGTCLFLNGAGQWAVTAPGGTKLASGTLGPYFAAGSWHSLKLSLQPSGGVSSSSSSSSVIHAYVDTVEVTPSGGVVAKDGGRGMVALGSGWHEAQWDNLRIQAM